MAKIGEGAHYRSRGGDSLSEAEIEQLADEAQAGYDLEHSIGRRLGRPSLGQGVSPRVSVRLSPALYEAARQRASREGRKVSDVAREAIERYVAEESRE